jgi:hypothetical protein
VFAASRLAGSSNRDGGREHGLEGMVIADL